MAFATESGADSPRIGGDFTVQNQPQFHKKGSFRTAKAVVISMKASFKKNFGTICIALGILLVCASVFILISDMVARHLGQKKAQDAVKQLESMLPPLCSGVGHDGTNPEDGMAVLEIGGVDYVGILCVPTLGIKLPVSGGRTASSEAIVYCISGNAPSGSLMLGGSGDEFKKLEDLDIGERISFTDVRGNVWEYRLSHSTFKNTMPGKPSEDVELTILIEDKNRCFVIDCVFD